MMRENRGAVIVLLVVLGGCQPGSQEPAPYGFGATDLPPTSSDSLRISSVEPPAWSNLGGIPLELTGQAFSVGASVTIDGIPVGPATVLSATQLVVPLPARPGAFGPVPLVVTNPDGQASPPSYLFSYSTPEVDFPFVRYPTGYEPRAVAIADLDGDGRLDLVTPNLESNDVAVLYGQGQGRFAPARLFAAGSGPRSVVIADFNQDRVPDIAVANQVGNGASVLLGDGRGGFLAPKTTTATSLVLPVSIATGDLNHDGYPDLVLALYEPNKVWVLLGDGTGGFTDNGQLPSGGIDPVQVALGDLNRDGNLDIAVVLNSSDAIGIFLGDGRGSFASIPLVKTTADPAAIAIGDVNGDGKLDLVTGSAPASNTASGRIRVLLGNGLGGFATGVTLIPNSDVAALTLADMNRDGHLDLVAGLLTKKLSVQFGDGTGGFGTASFLGISAVDGVATGDLDGDGYLDLAAANAGLDSVSVVLGDGRGAWTPLQFYPTPGIPHATVTADFNQDGQPDLATIANTANTVSLLFGTGSGLQPGGVLPVGKAPRAIAVADLNRDQKADLIVANEGEQTLSLLIGDGAGGFIAAAPISVSEPPWALAAADLDQDGYVDLAVASSMAQIEILFGDGTAGVKRRLTLTLPWSSAFISPGDINGDGRPDLVLGSFNGAFITALLSDGSGGFVRGQSKQLGTPPRDARLVDLNRDGALDLILISVDDVRVLLGDGHGSFIDHYLLNVGYDTPIALQVADMNGDWKPDIVVIGYFLPDVMVLLGDGTGSFTSGKSFIIGGKLSTFHGSPGRSLAVADFDRDGLLDLAVPTIDPDRVVVLPNLSRR